jgi:hypothetical protein
MFQILNGHPVRRFSAAVGTTCSVAMRLSSPREGDRDRSDALLHSAELCTAEPGSIPQTYPTPQATTVHLAAQSSYDINAIGRGSGAVAGNVVLGNSALAVKVAGVYNTAVGSVVLQDNIEGIDNTGVGNIAL